MNKLDTIIVTIDEMSRSELQAISSKGRMIHNMLTPRGTINDCTKFRDVRSMENIALYNAVRSLSYCRYEVSMPTACQEFPSIDHII